MQESIVFISRGMFLITNILLLYIFLTPKRPFWFQITALSVTWIAIYFLRDILQSIIPDPFLVGYLVGSLYIIPCALIFKETINAKLFVFFMIFSLSQFTFLIFLFLEQLVFNHLVGSLILAGLLLEAASLPLIKKYVSPHVSNIIAIIDQRNFAFTCFPLLSFVLLAFYGVQRTYLLSNFIPLVVSTLLILFTYYLIATAIYQTMRNQQAEKQLALQREHYRSLNDSINAMKTMRHDLRHHLVTCLEFLVKKNSAAAENYLGQLCNHYDDIAIPKVCSNQFADALICHYLKVAKEQGVNINTNLHLPDDLGIDDQDLCVILGNCLENAIEACSKIPKNQLRYIDIKTTITKNHLVIKIANSFCGSAIRQGDSFVSSKNGDSHGMGLSSVKALTSKYHGYCSINCEQQVFKVAVSLKLPETVAESQSLSIS
ncbi:hypothetical protein SDC9_03964 [bioreactor metagenome]|uniref:Sensor histidine kinase NatK-like C-terminal domain-containing protein n=1 Tax=bioreactor metagenome TaxID=1076179 RepID=A0A644SXR6_9ZZZZ|nr:GHKL domain-containing protein [Negativicutes bacterium]